MTQTDPMKAAISEQYGTPDVLRIGELPRPIPKADDVLVRVHYSTVTRTDCGFLAADPAIVRLFAGLAKPNSIVLGCEFAGEVVQVGEQVTRFEPGDRVVGFKDDDYGFGGHAEYTVIPQHNNALLAHIPDHLSYRDAAPALEGSHYALHGIRACEVNEHSRVLVNGGTGSIGSAAIQIMAAMGADVTAVCATPHLDTVSSLGANRVIDYLNEDFTELNDRFDVVYDAVGKSTFGRARRVLTTNGVYLSTELGPFSQNPFLALIPRWIMKQQVKFPIPKNRVEDALYLTQLMQQRQYQPLIDREFTLEDVAEAYRYVRTGEKIGNVVLRVKN